MQTYFNLYHRRRTRSLCRFLFRQCRPYNFRRPKNIPPQKNNSYCRGSAHPGCAGRDYRFSNGFKKFLNDMCKTCKEALGTPPSNYLRAKELCDERISPIFASKTIRHFKDFSYFVWVVIIVVGVVLFLEFKKW